MAREIDSPLQMQIKHATTLGFSGIKIFEHKGASGTFYKAGDNVPVRSEYVNGGKTLPADYIKSATHTHRDTKVLIDGVNVEIVGMTPAEAEEVDDELFEF